ncbi:TPA: hypothetical protein N6440_004262 [Escherichia coli]|nr:hypothetical protein [Escherichia coli]
MNMHKSLVAVLGLILISSTASAATCRAGSAAHVTNGAIVIHTQRLKSDPGGNLLS